MKFIPLFPAIALLIFINQARAQPSKKCCDEETCRQKATAYAVKITGLVAYLGTFNEANPEANEQTLATLKNNSPQVYRDFIKTAQEIAVYIFDQPSFANSLICFTDALPTLNKSNVVAWINYFRTAVKKPSFPSTEFCGGWKKRFEIAQGATAFLSKTKMAYFGTVRGLLAYTFRKKNECGGSFRLMAGPAFFLRNKNSYTALSSRLGIRLSDLKASVFSLGNLNVFGGYTTNFDHFEYAEAGLEVELGPFGVNVAANYNINNKKPGFLAGILFGNKKL